MTLRSGLVTLILLAGCANQDGAGGRAATPEVDSGRERPPVVDAAGSEAAPRHLRDAGSFATEASPESNPAMADASTDASDGSRADACTGSVAVTGGTVAGASTLAFGATRLRDGAWSVSSLPTNVGQAPAIIAYDGGFAAAFVDGAGELEFATSTWTWSSPSALGGVAAVGSPSLAVVGADLHVLYQGTDSKFFHGIYTPGAGWDEPIDPVGGSEQGFGPSAPAAATVAGELLIAYVGQDGLLYDETWSGGAWGPSNPHPAAQTGQLTPSVVALLGGASDALVVYADPGGVFHFTVRAGGGWSAPEVLNTDAFTGAPASVAPLAAGRAVMTYLGTNKLPYFSVYDPGATPPWTAPAPIDANGPELVSPPAIAPGVCGDEAMAILVQPAGVAVVRYAGGAWVAPTMLEGTSGMTVAGIASQP